MGGWTSAPPGRALVQSWLPRPTGTQYENDVEAAGYVDGEQAGGDGRLALGLRAAWPVAHLNRAVGGRQANRRLGRNIRVVVLRRPPGRWGEAGRDVHEQGHCGAAEVVGAAA